MTAPMSSRSTELVEIRGLDSSFGYFGEKEFLSVEEVYDSLPKKRLNSAGECMKSNIERTRSDIFLHLPLEFSISGLQHCTTLDSTRKILESQSFRGREQDTSRSDFINLSFWAANVSSAQRTRARKAANTHVQKHVPHHEAEEYKREIRQQITNSPAFNKSASRYGNFHFSLPFSDLLYQYGLQFCEGEEPQLSILGTDIYKQEIVHYVVVHKLDNTRFKDHPRVPRLQTKCEPLPVVFLLGKKLYWRPESTSNALKVLTKDGHLTACNQPILCDWHKSEGHCIHTVKCPWNHLVIAFHIPQGDVFKIDRDKLINKLSACKADKRFIGKSIMTKDEAKTQIDKLKQQYVERNQKRQPKVDSRHGEQSDRRANRTPLTDNVEGRRERAPNTGNKEVTITQMDTSTQKSCPPSTRVRVKQKRTGDSVTGKHAADKENKRGGPHQKHSLRTDSPKISTFFRSQPRVPAEEVEVGEQPSTPVRLKQKRNGGSVTGKHAADKENKRGGPHQKRSLRTDSPKISTFFQSQPRVPAEEEVGEQPSTPVRLKQERNGGSVTGKHAADKENKRGGPHQKPLMRTDYPKISKFFRSQPRVPAEEVEVGEQASACVRVKQKRNGGSVTGKHAADKENRGDPCEIGENVEQCGPPLKKKK